jgi:hypothetical protein
MTMSFELAAKQLAQEIRASGRGFLTVSKEQLRQRFDIGRLTANLSAAVEESLEAVDLIAAPPPSEAGMNLRIYDLKHPLGAAAQSVTWPDRSTDAPLMELSDLVSRAQAGRELRSEDVPWLDALQMLFQLSLGREPEGWEDVRDDRHSSELARNLAGELGLDEMVLESNTFLRLAAVVDCYQPPERPLQAADLVTEADLAFDPFNLLAAVQETQQRMAEQQKQLLTTIARSFLQGAEPPDKHVEVGLLGLRRRRERAA